MCFPPSRLYVAKFLKFTVEFSTPLLYMDLLISSLVKARFHTLTVYKKLKKENKNSRGCQRQFVFEIITMVNAVFNDNIEPLKHTIDQSFSISIIGVLIRQRLWFLAINIPNNFALQFVLIYLRPVAK